MDWDSLKSDVSSVGVDPKLQQKEKVKEEAPAESKSDDERRAEHVAKIDSMTDEEKQQHLAKVLSTGVGIMMKLLDDAMNRYFANPEKISGKEGLVDGPTVLGAYAGMMLIRRKLLRYAKNMEIGEEMLDSSLQPFRDEMIQSYDRHLDELDARSKGEGGNDIVVKILKQLGVIPDNAQVVSVGMVEMSKKKKGED